MYSNALLKSALLVAVSLGPLAAHASNLSRAEYNAEQTRIRADYKIDHARCDSLTGNGKDVCVEQAKANKKIAAAELEFHFTGDKSDARKARTARAEAEYSVAKEKCGAQMGNEKDVCVEEAKAAQTKALADVKMGKQIGDARTDAASDQRDADYKVAVERCDSYSGDSKDSCLAAARAKFGRS